MQCAEIDIASLDKRTAILKGWVDRVLRENVAYTFPAGDNGGGLPIGLSKAKVGLVSILSIPRKGEKLKN